MGQTLFELQVRIRNMLGIVDTDWMKLTSGISVLTGRNNVGKSRILRLIGQRKADVRLHEDDVCVEMGLTEHGFPEQYVVRDNSGVHTTEWEGDGQWRNLKMQGGGRSWESTTHFSQLLSLLPEGSRVAPALERIIYLPPQRQVVPTVATTSKREPDPSAVDLVNVIYTHRDDDTEQYRQIMAEMEVLFPELEMILTPATSPHNVTLELRDRFARDRVSIDNAGTGVAQTLHLITSILCLPPGRIFLVDEPHAFLHPAVERLLVQFLRQHDEHWYVCATHSPVFINAAEPEHSWLVTRDEAGTRIRSVFDERLPRRHVLMEVGIQPGDVAFAERVVFVEGPTEERVFPILLTRLGWDPALQNCAIIGLEGCSTAPVFARAVDQLAELLQIEFTICLDGDAQSKYRHLPKVRFLNVNELEDVFLRDAAAVREGSWPKCAICVRSRRSTRTTRSVTKPSRTLHRSHDRMICALSRRPSI